MTDSVRYDQSRRQSIDRHPRLTFQKSDRRSGVEVTENHTPEQRRRDVSDNGDRKSGLREDTRNERSHDQPPSFDFSSAPKEDVDRLVDRLYGELERKVRIERERRGR